MPKSNEAKPSAPTTPLARSLADLLQRRGKAAFSVLSAVSGVPVPRLKDLHNGAEPTMMEEASLGALAQGRFDNKLE